MTENGSLWERELVTKLATAALKEQRRARLWGIFFKLLTFAYVTVILLLAVDWQSADVTGGKKHTAMVEVNGLIAPGADASAEKITSALQAAFKDVKALHDRRAENRKAMEAAMQEKTIDPAKVEAIRAEQMKVADEASKRFTQALIEAGNVLTAGIVDHQDFKVVKGLRAHARQRLCEQISAILRRNDDADNGHRRCEDT